jgi:polar amino acid transport system substrate-binding protein
MIKNLMISISTLFFACSLYAAEPIKVTIYTDDDYEPYSYIDQGEAKGIYVDIIAAVFKKMPAYKVLIKAVPWARGKKMMEMGKGLGLADAYFHGHDWPYLYPYSISFGQEVLNVYCNEKVLSELKPQWPEDYAGLRIGRPSGFGGWGGPEFDEMVKNKTIKLEESKGGITQILKLGLGRVDCIVCEEVMFNLELRKAQENGIYKSNWAKPKLGAAVSINDLYIGYSKKAIQSGKYPFHMDFRQKFDSELFKMIQSGERDRILNGL